MDLFILFFLLFLLLIFFPITVKVKIDYDLLKNEGLLFLYLFGIRIISRKWKIGINKIRIFAKNKKEKQMIIFDFDDGASGYGDYYLKDVLKRIDINTLKIFATVGVEDYAMYTAIINYALNLPTNIGLHLINHLKQPRKIISQILPDFYKNNCFIAVCTSVTGTIAMLFISLIASYIKFKNKKRKYSYGK